MHGSQVCQQGHAREVPAAPRASHDERNFILAFCVWCPLGQLFHMLCRDLAPIAVAQQPDSRTTESIREAWDLRKLLGQRRQRIELAFFAKGLGNSRKVSGNAWVTGWGERHGEILGMKGDETILSALYQYASRRLCNLKTSKSSAFKR